MSAERALSEWLYHIGKLKKLLFRLVFSNVLGFLLQYFWKYGSYIDINLISAPRLC